MSKRRLVKAGTSLLLLLSACGAARGADWPTYQHDNARSGVTTERIAPPLALQWVFESPHPPARGWPEPEPGGVWSYGIERVAKARYDDSFPVAAVGEAVYFASSAENKVYSLEARTGKLRWTAYTDAPPRLAPTVWRGKVYVGADDGRVYCLSADDGKPLWTFRAAPHADRALGHGKVMSIWPVRTGVLVDSGTAYFGAGLFPAEGLYLYAVRADDGRLVWRNDTHDQAGRGTISPQGYLLAAEGKLVMPSGRVTPAVFDPADGRLLFTIPGGRALSGGTYATLGAGRLYNGTQLLTAYDLVSTKKDKYGRDVKGPAIFSFYRARRIVLDRPAAYVATDSELLAIPEATMPAAAKQIDAVRKASWGKRNQVRAHERLRKDLAALKPKDPRRERLAKEMARLRPHYEAVAAARKKLNEYLDRACKWRLPCAASDSLILAGGVLFAGGEGRVIAVDAASGRKIWTHDVSGAARALAAADGRLLVSTTTGNIYCFAPRSAAGGKPAKKVGPPARAQPYPDDDLGRVCQATAERIVRETGIRRGYCLLLGGGTGLRHGVVASPTEPGRLAYELAKRTELRIYVVEPDAKKVAQARARLSQAGLYGARVCVERGALSPLSYPSYFANLIVCQEAFLGGAISTPAKDLLRVLRPLGGVAYVGQPPEAKGLGKALDPRRLKAWLGGLPGGNVKTSVRGAWARITRGALSGAGGWSHQYATCANTVCSEDRLVKGPLGLLWFGDPGPRRMIDRHSRGPAPLSTKGRLFIEGRDVVMAYDAYNGLGLWEREIAGAGRQNVSEDCSNLAATEDSLFVAAGDKCLRLDAATGRTRRTYSVPPRKDGQPRRWGWIAVSGDLLFGSRTETARPYRGWPDASGNTSESVFALDVATGRVQWVYDGKGILHPSIAAGDGAVFLIDRAVTEPQRARAIKDRIRDADEKGSPTVDRRGKPIERDVRRVVALDAATGAERWAEPLDVTDCVVGPEKRARAGGAISLLYKNNVLVLCSAPWNGHFMDEWHAGRFSRRSLIALAGDTGKLLWSGRKGYRSRPLIVGDTIFAEPWAHDLRTGATRMHSHPVTGRKEKWTMWRGYGGCGTVAASAGALFFRAGSIGYYDLAADEGLVHWGAQRPSCWINAIPAGGLVLIPEGSAYCDCPLAIQCTVALRPMPRPRAWAEYPLAKPLVPVRHLAVNLGAPGDRRDERGRLWIHCPNRVHKWHWLGSAFLKTPRAGYYCYEADALDVRGTDRPWVFASAGRGLRSFTVPLIPKGSKPAVYTVRLYFAEPADLSRGKRVFDVSVQGKRVLKDFDIVEAAGGPRRAIVKEFKGVEVTDVLTVALTPSAQAGVKLPILCGVEAVRETAGSP